MAAATPLSSVPSRFLCKGPEYFRSTSIASQTSDDRRLTATERLEADKLKYVKSAQARRRRATCDFHQCAAGRNTDSTGSHSAGSDSTISPAEDGDDVSDYVGNDVIAGARLNPKENLNLCLSPKADHYYTDVIVRVRPHANTRRPRPRPRSSYVEGMSFQVEKKNENYAKRLNFANDENNATINHPKSQENGRTANDTSHHNSNQSDKQRQSRSLQSKPTYIRSSSVGAGTPPQQRHTHESPKNLELPHSDNLVLSPRSQIRNARKNLKKISAKTDETPAIPVADGRLRSATHTNSSPEENRRQSATITVKLRPHKPHRTRPFSVIENINRFEFGASLQPVNVKPKDNKTAQNQISVEPCTRGDNKLGNHGKDLTADTSGPSSARLMSGQYLKRRSIDFSHTIDSNLQLPVAKPAIVEFSPEVADSDATPTEPQREVLFQEQRLACSMNFAGTPRSIGKETSHEDSDQTTPGFSRDITEALEKILHPLDRDDEMDTGYNSMDASADSRTLVATPCREKDIRKSSIAASINSALNGCKYDEKSRKSKSPVSPQEDGCENTFFKPPENWKQNRHMDKPAVTVPRDRQWVNDRNSNITSQPFSRIDLAPSSGESRSNGTLQSSPMLAPRARKEVAPDYSVSGKTASLSRSGDERDGQFGTMKSHTTVTTTSGDNNKPLTTLTASDLKPRRGRRGSNPYSTPVKPTCPYPAENEAGPKRQNSTPFSLTASPNKQMVRNNPPHSARSASSTPYSSLRRNPITSRSSSLKRNRQRSKSDVSTFQSELDHFFSSMGMEESRLSPYPSCDCNGAHVSSESDFSFAGASAYVRDGPDEPMEVDPVTARLANVPAVSVIEKNARVMRWIMSCKKNLAPSQCRSPRRAPPTPNVPPRPHVYKQPIHHTYSNCAPPIPPRSYHSMATIIPKETNV